MTAVIVVLVVIAVLLIVVVAALAWKRVQSRKLQKRYGSEYDLSMQQTGSRKQAEQDLRERADRRAQLDIQPLDPTAREEYAQRWRIAQERFVDAPNLTITEADALVTQVMRDRGYPLTGFEQQARDVSVDHGPVVQEYREAHKIALLNDQNRASTEKLREAMVHYRALFEELLEPHG